MKELVFSRCLLPTMEHNATATGFIDAGTGRTVTFGEHLSRVARLSDALSRELAVTPTDRVAVLGANSLPFLELWHAGLLGAAVINPLNLRFSADELAYVLADSESTVCFVDASFAEVVDKIRGLTALKQVVLIGEGDVPADVRYDELLDSANEQLPDEPDENQPAALIYTGGTTGRPKGVVLDQRAEVLNQYHFAMRVPWQVDSPFLLQTPMFHGASMLGIVGSPMFGNPTVVLPGFEPSASLDACETYEVGSTVLVPTMIAMTLAHPSFTPQRLRSLRRIVYGASPMPSALLERLLAVLPDTEFIQGYGMTEGCTILTTFSDADHRDGTRLGSAGRALPGVELSVQDLDGVPLEPLAVGEICARGGNFMSGYLNLPEETAGALRDGWYHSGDVGYLDESGYLFLVDRAKDMIISGGENVYSVEVENAICSHADVVQVAVIGIPHDMWGEAVHAVCVVRPGSSVTGEDIIAHARVSIAGYKVPRSVELRTEPLPMSAAMKVLKRELRAAHWHGMDRAIN
jgi:acyl-CoA synthetase (AMP-forming)/AMP-acid ligase II